MGGKISRYPSESNGATQEQEKNNITVIQLLTLHEVLFNQLIQIAKHTYLLLPYSN
jgi:hypothetical protein